MTVNQGNLHEAVEDFFTTASAHHFAGRGARLLRKMWLKTTAGLRSGATGLPMTCAPYPIRKVGSDSGASAWLSENAGKATCKRLSGVTLLARFAAEAKPFARAVRGHWGVENLLHWRLDVVLGDDASRIRKGNGPAIMTALRHLSVNRFDREPSPLSLAKKRHKADWNDDYLAKVRFS